MPLRRSFRMLLACVAALACQPAGPPEPPPGDCPDCDRRCTDGETTCHGKRAAVCQGGSWAERTCDVACFEGRCVDCVEDDRRCATTSTALHCVQGAFVEARCTDGCRDGRCVDCAAGVERCGTPADHQRCGDDGRWVAAPCPAERPLCLESGACGECSPGVLECDGALSRACDAGGTWEVSHCDGACEMLSHQCPPSCEAETYRCDQGTVQRCHDSGRGWVSVERCDVRGERGEAEACSEGQCVSTCALAELAASPDGCRFVAPPIEYLNQKFARETTGPGPDTVLYLINPSSEFRASVVVRQDGVDTPVSVPAGRSSYALVRARAVSTEASTRLPSGAVDVRSNRPIFVVAHFDLSTYPHADGEGSFSGDTAFLLPHHLVQGYGRRYRVLTQPTCVSHEGVTIRPGGFTVVSSSPEPAELTFHFSAATASSSDGSLPAFAAGGAQSLTLLPEEVIHFRADRVAGTDLTGTLIESSAPVAVFNGGVSRVPCTGGHVQTQLLEQLMPVGLWGDSSAADHTHLLAAREGGHERWVIVTDEPGNQLTFDPPAPPYSDSVISQNPGTASHTLGSAGQTFAFNTAEENPGPRRFFTLTSTHPVLVGRYFYVTNTQGGSTFTLERPVTFWRSHYEIESVGVATNRLLLIVPAGETPTLDGAPIVALRGAGPAGHELLTAEVSRGPHRIGSSQSFGLLVHGFQMNESDMLPSNCYSYSGPVGFRDSF